MFSFGSFNRLARPCKASYPWKVNNRAAKLAVSATAGAMIGQTWGQLMLGELKIGLALSGGAAYGYAHLPVLQAFEDLGVKPSVLAGTSMGAIGCATYAAGYSPKDLLEHTQEVFELRSALFKRLPRLLPNHLKASMKDWNPLSLDPYAVLDEFMMPVPETFDDLSIETHLVATNFSTGAAVDFHKGALKPAVAASMAIPGVFKPVYIDGAAHLDGGLVSPLPVEFLPDDCDIVIASSVIGAASRTTAFLPPEDASKNLKFNEIMLGCVQILTSQLVQNSTRKRQPDLLLWGTQADFKPFDFMKAKEISSANHALGDAVKSYLSEAIEARIQGRTLPKQEMTCPHPKPQASPAEDASDQAPATIEPPVLV